MSNRLLGQVVALTLSMLSFNGEAAVLKVADWPPATECTACTRLQIWKLDLQVPAKIIHGILSLDSETGGLGFLPPSGDFDETTYIVKHRFEPVPQLSVRRRFFETHGIKTTVEFLNRLGTEPSTDDKDLRILRMSTGIDEATSFTRLEKKPLTAFVLDSVDPAKRRLWIVIDGDDMYYEFLGPMTPTLVQAILTHARAAYLP